MKNTAGLKKKVQSSKTENLENFNSKYLIHCRALDLNCN